MKKNDIHPNQELDCEDDAFEVKNAMLLTALMAGDEHRQAVVAHPGETDEKMLKSMKNNKEEEH
jgi:hypothetical protein